MFKKVLIANRGEIAVRIVRSLRELGIKSVVIYSDIDKDSLAVKIADEAYNIGGTKANESYLKYQKILEVAVASKADAIHPGYGFLSENSDFAEACRAIGVEFIGPSAESIVLMGDKSKAREIAMRAGAPVVPGSDGEIKDLSHLKKIAKEIGYPVLLKASFGGGGRGMRIANDESELENAYLSAKAEANAAFGNDSMYLEKFIVNPSHIEVQVLADKFGNILAFPERDCSIQRRHQKLLEETPSPKITPEIRQNLMDAAIKIVKESEYFSAGTIEFILDENRDFYFIEMNTRIQVEHPITEEITGVDLIAEQVKIAAGENLQISQEDIKINGHCIECRINAEDPDKNFIPNPGKIENLIFPGGPGIRLDLGVYSGSMISPFYDSMVAKLIIKANNRQLAINRARRSLEEFFIDGIKTTIPIFRKIFDDKDFISGKYSTNFIETKFK